MGYSWQDLDRNDGEFALVDLLNRVGQLRQGDTLLEQSPVTDYRANGRAERAVQKVQKKTRVLKLATEENLKMKIPVNHPGFPCCCCCGCCVVPSLLLLLLSVEAKHNN